MSTMTEHAAPLTIAGQWEAAQKIRKQVWPLNKPQMSNKEAGLINRLEREQFEAWGLPYCVTSNTGSTVMGEHVWHTGRTESGRLVGIWCDNEIEAAVRLMVGYGEPLQFVTRDENCDLYNAEKRKAAKAEKDRKAIKAKQQKTRDRYNDTTTNPRRLKATKTEGMLF